MHKTLSVTAARQQLLKLTKDIDRRMGKVVLTNKGEAQAILLSMGEYNSLRAAAEVVARPEIRRASDEGFEQLRRGKGVKLSKAMPRPATHTRSSAPQPAESRTNTNAG